MDSDKYSFSRLEKGALVVGFVSLAVAVLNAHGSPPESYELSIYAATPVSFWLGAAVALLAAVIVGLRASGTGRRVAVVLGGATTLSMASLPVIRSYHFYGAGDALTHLGWTKDIAAGEMSVLTLIYPAPHTIAVFLSDVTGMSLNRALLVMVMAFTAVFLVFVPLTTWAMTRDRRTATFAAFAGFLLLPITNVAVFVIPYPTVQAIMFFPLVLYLLARYVTRADREQLPVGTQTGVLLALASAAMVLVHPQQTANVVLTFGAILAFQLLANRVLGRELDHRLVAFQTLFVGGVFLFWVTQHDTATGAISYLSTALLTDIESAEAVRQQTLSLSEVGGSIVALFLKLFLASVVFSALTGLFVLRGLADRFPDADTNVFARYFGLGLVPVFGLFVAYLLTSYGKYHFRQLGFIMVLATILGGIALKHVVDGISARTSGRTGRTVAGVVVVLLLALSAPTIHQSPYMYQGSSHVTEAQSSGFEKAFEQRGSHGFIGIRGTGERWIDGTYGVDERRREMAIGSLYASDRHPASGENFTGSYIATHFDDRYLAFTDRVRQQELRVYDGFRFDRAGFRSINATPGLHRVQANGDMQTYLINDTA